MALGWRRTRRPPRKRGKKKDGRRKTRYMWGPETWPGGRIRKQGPTEERNCRQSWGKKKFKKHRIYMKRQKKHDGGDIKLPKSEDLNTFWRKTLYCEGGLDGLGECGG